MRIEFPNDADSVKFKPLIDVHRNFNPDEYVDWMDSLGVRTASIPVGFSVIRVQFGNSRVQITPLSQPEFEQREQLHQIMDEGTRWRVEATRNVEQRPLRKRLRKEMFDTTYEMIVNIQSMYDAARQSD